MEQATKKARTVDEEWMLISSNQDLAQHAEHIIAGKPLNHSSAPKFYFVQPTQTALITKPGDNLYTFYACERGSNPRTFNFSHSNNLLAQFPWHVRRLLFEEAHDLHNGIQSQDILVSHEVLSLEDGYTGQLVPVLPDEGRDLFKISCLTRKEQMRYLNPALITLLGVHKHRNSALSALHKDVARLICKIAISDALRNDIPLEFKQQEI
jgi:hypothetical protein